MISAMGLQVFARSASTDFLLNIMHSVCICSRKANNFERIIGPQIQCGSNKSSAQELVISPLITHTLQKHLYANAHRASQMQKHHHVSQCHCQKTIPPLPLDLMDLSLSQVW